MNLDKEQLTDELVKRAKGRSAMYGLSADPETRHVFDLVKRINSIPRAAVPMANFERIKNQILDRISIPKDEPSTSMLGMFVAAIPRFVKISSIALGSFIILVGGALGVSAAATQSLPGQPIYPIKKVVENVQLKLASTEEEKANLQIKFANNRLEELEKVLAQSNQGKVSGATVQKIVDNISKTATSVSEKSTQDQPANIATKLMDLNNKQTALLQNASSNSAGQAKAEIDKALVTAKDSHDQTIQNIEKAGLKVEDQPIAITDQTDDTALVNGKITLVSSTSISIGTSKFLLTKDTKFVNIKQDDLKVGITVEIKGQVIQSNTYALEITPKAASASDSTTIPKPTDKTVPDDSGK